MKIILTEKQCESLIHLLKEQSSDGVFINTTYDKSFDYKLDNGKYYFKGKGLKSKQFPDWTEATGKALDSIKTKVKFIDKKNYISPVNDYRKSTTNTNKVTNTNINNISSISTNCQKISPNSKDIVDLNEIIRYWGEKYPNYNVYDLINGIKDKLANMYKTKDIPTEISCEIALIQIRPTYKDKNAIIVDTFNKLIYIFSPNGKFIGKSDIISGKNEQSVDPKVIANALLTWEQKANELGFKWVDGKGYVNLKKPNEKYDEKKIFDYIDKKGTRFLPKGVYSTSNKVDSASEYAGGKDNLLRLFKGNTEVTQAIHGYYVEQPRTEALKKARQVLSNPNDPKVSNEFLKMVQGGDVTLNQSYGCINLPKEFLPMLKKYMVNSYVFNIGEDRKNYLVQADKVENYFDKMMNTEGCPSPKYLGMEPLTGIA